MATGWPMKTTYANGDVYSAGDVNDITGTINLLGSSVAYAAGKNRILNSDFSIWQRGTSFSPATGVGAFTADRYFVNCNFTAGTATFSRQTFTPGTAPVAGYEGTFFHRITAASTTSYFEISQKIEDVRTYAGQRITISFWAKQSSSTGIKLLIRQNFGSGGSANVDQEVAATITSAWARYSFSFTLGSLAGKTIGTSNFLQMYLFTTGAVTGSMTFDTWGWQLEQGSTATAFQTATGTIQGELAACQRYTLATTQLNGVVYNAGAALMSICFPAEMRTAPTLTSPTGPYTSFLNEVFVALRTPTTLTIAASATTSCLITISGAAGMTQGNTVTFNTPASNPVLFSAEL